MIPPSSTIRLLSLALATAGLVATALPGGAQEPSLEELMKGLKSQLKVLSGAVQNPEHDHTSLSALDEMEILAIAAKRRLPAHLGEIPEGRQAAHIKAFRADMARLLQQLAIIEVAILEGHNDRAFELIRKDLLNLRESAHDKFQ